MNDLGLLHRAVWFKPDCETTQAALADELITEYGWETDAALTFAKRRAKRAKDFCGDDAQRAVLSGIQIN